MRIVQDFDGGVCPPVSIEDDSIRFDLRPGQRRLNVWITDAPTQVDIDLLCDEKGAVFVERQGLLVSDDGRRWSARPLTRMDEGFLRARLTCDDGELHVATRYPYGRDDLDRLICDTAGRGVRWHVHDRGRRSVLMAEFGDDDGRRPVHYFLAGEDAWETAGTFAVDAMVRELCDNDDLATCLADKAVVRLIPAVSPFSLTTDVGSYRTLDGGEIYGAATWSQPDPPPEYAIVRGLVERSIEQRRLGCLLTLHSWQAQSEHCGLETIASSGDNTLDEARRTWAAATMRRLSAGMETVRIALPETIWHPGLARDYLLGRHNAATFRIELSTIDAGCDQFAQMGRRFMANLAAIDDWTGVLGKQ